MSDPYSLISHIKLTLDKFLLSVKPDLQLSIFSTTCQIFHSYLSHFQEPNDIFIVACSSIYLACKVEEAPIKAKRLMELLGHGEREDLVVLTVSLEIKILEVLDFNISFDSPFIALQGILLEFKAYDIFPPDLNHNKFYEACIKFIKTAILMPAIHENSSMSQVACASVYRLYGKKYCELYLQ